MTRTKNQTASKPRRGKAVSVRRVYHAPEQMRAAFLAGEGRSGGEIADILGGTSGPRIRAMLRKCGVKMINRPGAERVIQIRLPRRDGLLLDAAADQLELDPSILAAWILRSVLPSETMVKNLVEERDGDIA